MGWKTINGRRYYYVSKRVGKRVETHYGGSGELGRVMAECSRIQRLERAEAILREREIRDEAESEDRAVEEWFHEVQAMAEAALVEAGCHKHKGRWRRRRA